MIGTENSKATVRDLQASQAILQAAIEGMSRRLDALSAEVRHVEGEQRRAQQFYGHAVSIPMAHYPLDGLDSRSRWQFAEKTGENLTDYLLEKGMTLANMHQWADFWKTDNVRYVIVPPVLYDRYKMLLHPRSCFTDLWLGSENNLKFRNMSLVKDGTPEALKVRGKA